MVRDVDEPLAARVEAAVIEARAQLLELAVEVETRVDQALSVYLAADDRAQQMLYRDVIWRTPLDRRVALLTQLLEEEGLAEAFPFLAHAAEIIDTRNVLAHMVLEVFESTDEELVFIGRRSGDDRRKVLSVERVCGLPALRSGLLGDLGDLVEHLVETRDRTEPTPAADREAGTTE